MTLIQGENRPQPQAERLEPLILVPYVQGMLHEETVQAITDSGYPYTLWPLNRDNPYDYASLFAAWWTKPGDLIIVEQDIVPPAGAIDAMVKCERPWCSHSYYCNNPMPAYGLGLCRFTWAIKQIHPTLGEQAARDFRGNARRMHWMNLNERIIDLMNHWGITVHLHEPFAEHLHDYGTSDVSAG